MMVQDLLAILPMMDDLILLDVSGEMIHKVSKLLILILNEFYMFILFVICL